MKSVKLVLAQLEGCPQMMLHLNHGRARYGLGKQLAPSKIFIFIKKY